VPFNGTKINWEITSIEDGNRTSASSSDASSKSSKCAAGNSIATMGQMEDNLMTMTISGKVYPNPVKNRVTIADKISDDEISGLRIFDIQGRMFRPLSTRRISATSVELDLTNLPTGQYLIRSASKSYKIIKE
jgi:hypothetical protein